MPPDPPRSMAPSTPTFKILAKSLRPKEAKRYESPFGSVADRSTIHFRLKRLTIPAGSYKKSCYLKVFLKTGSFQCCAVDIK